MKAVVGLLVAAACGRFGFDDTQHGNDAARLDGDGSGVPAPFVPQWHSGSRLRARLLEGGGDPIFYGWHDTQLGTDCEKTVATDGRERCIPRVDPAGTIFSDAACTQPLALVYRGTCGIDTYAYLDDSAGTHAFPIGALYSGTVYSMQGTCSPTSLASGTEAHAVGAEVAPAAFAPSTYHHAVVGAFEHVFNDFSDGATIDIGELEVGDVSCDAIGSELGAERCRTTAPRATLGYADAGCTQSILVWSRTPYDPPTATAFAVFPPQACDTTYTYYHAIADVTAPQYWVKDAGACTMVTTAANVALYTATAMTDPSPIGTVVRGPDRGRIGTLYWLGPDSVAMPVGNFDQQTGLPCTPFNASDGVLRCLPSAPLAEPAIEDATCTGAAAAIDGECFGAPPVEGPSYSSCVDAGWRVHALTAAIPAASIDDDGACTAIELPGGVAYDHATLGAELAPSMFPALTERVE